MQSCQQEEEGVKKDGEDEAKPEVEEKKNSVDNENTILDYKEGDDLQGTTQDMFPAYR